MWVKNILGQQKFVSSKILIKINLGKKKFVSSKILIKKNLDPTKLGPKILVHIDFLTMDKYHQDKCHLEKCYPDMWHLVKMGPETFLDSLVKIG